MSLDRHINILNSDTMLSVIDSVACFIVVVLIISWKVVRCTHVQMLPETNTMIPYS